MLWVAMISQFVQPVTLSTEGFPPLSHDPDVAWKNPCTLVLMPAPHKCLSDIAGVTSIPQAKKTTVSHKLLLQTLEYR